MVLTPELAERVQDIYREYRENLELEFRDPLIVGPISVEPTQNSEGEALFLVTIVYDGQAEDPDTGEALAAVTAAESPLLALGIRVLPTWSFAPEH